MYSIHILATVLIYSCALLHLCLSFYLLYVLWGRSNSVGHLFDALLSERELQKCYWNSQNHNPLTIALHFVFCIFVFCMCVCVLLKVLSVYVSL